MAIGAKASNLSGYHDKQFPVDDDIVKEITQPYVPLLYTAYESYASPMSNEDNMSIEIRRSEMPGTGKQLYLTAIHFPEWEPIYGNFNLESIPDPASVYNGIDVTGVGSPPWPSINNLDMPSALTYSDGYWFDKDTVTLYLASWDVNGVSMLMTKVLFGFDVSNGSYFTLSITDIAYV